MQTWHTTYIQTHRDFSNLVESNFGQVYTIMACAFETFGVPEFQIQYREFVNCYRFAKISVSNLWAENHHNSRRNPPQAELGDVPYPAFYPWGSGA